MTCDVCRLWTAQSRTVLERQRLVMKTNPKSMPACPRCKTRHWATSDEALPETRELHNFVAELHDFVTKSGLKPDRDRSLYFVATALIVGIVLILVMLYVRTSRAEDCLAAKGAGSHWSWRQIDGRRCWYQGLPGRTKSTLNWGKASDKTPAQAERTFPGEAGTATVSHPDGGPGSSSDQARAWPRPDVRVGESLSESADPGAAVLTEDELLARTCCWPDLQELEADVIGLRKRSI